MTQTRLRERLTISLTAALALLLAIPLEARQLKLDDPTDALTARRKLLCSLTDGAPTLFWWQGTLMSRVEGERDRKLFNVQGMNIRTCKTFQDPKRGLGFRTVSREVMLYLDPETNEVLKTWKNPWTDEMTSVVHVANDPVNMRAPLYAYGTDGKPFTFKPVIKNGRLIDGGATPLFYTNPMGGDYQDYVGGTYHAMEMGADYAYADEVLDSRVKAIKRHTIAWSRISNWLPWMKMGDRSGVVYTATVGARAASFDDLPEPLRSQIRTAYPAYLEPPPIDDPRPSITSWVSTKQAIDAAANAKSAGKE
jgi:Protein of unknown function (DUF1838)